MTMRAASAPWNCRNYKRHDGPGTVAPPRKVVLIHPVVEGRVVNESKRIRRAQRLSDGAMINVVEFACLGEPDREPRPLLGPGLVYRYETEDGTPLRTELAGVELLDVGARVRYRLTDLLF